MDPYAEPGILSFHNRWYPLVVDTALSVQLPSGRAISLIAAPAFIATKLEAFRDRGGGDFLMSHDLEDIVTVVDGRHHWWTKFMARLPRCVHISNRDFESLQLQRTSSTLSPDIFRAMRRANRGFRN